MRLPLIAALLLSSTMLAGAQDAQKEFPAKLLGHALLPANTMVAAPSDAPADLKVSGKFTTPGIALRCLGESEGGRADKGCHHQGKQTETDEHRKPFNEGQAHHQMNSGGDLTENPCGSIHNRR